MAESLIYKKNPNSRLRVYKFLQLENKCIRFLKDDEIISAAIINSMGNLVAGGLDQGKVGIEKDEQRRMLYMQMIFQISACRDFEESLGEIKFFAINRKNTLMIAFPLKNTALLIAAKPTASVDKIISKPHILEFLKSEILIGSNL